MKWMIGFVLVAGALTLAGCAATGVPSGCKPVRDFKLDRYLGRWYEAARLEQRFEKGMTNVSAEYSILKPGVVRVVNRGYLPEKHAWKTALGKAKFLGPATVGSLKVSFFGPFYGGYHVIALDQEGYQYAMVAGPTKGYLWILSRTPRMEKAVRDRLVDQARQAGFAVDDLIYVAQDDPPPPDPAGR